VLRAAAAHGVLPRLGINELGTLALAGRIDTGIREYGKPQEEAESILRDLGIAQYFALIVGGDGNFPLKPNPAALLYFAKENGSNPANCFMVGDHYTDLEAGFNAGMKTLFVKWGFGQPRNQKYDYIADSFAAGVKVILET